MIDSARVVIAATLALSSTGLPLDLDCQTKSDPSCPLQKMLELTIIDGNRNGTVTSWDENGEQQPIDDDVTQEP